MEPKKIALLVGALVIALVCALGVRALMLKSAAPVASAMPIPAALLPSAPKGPKVLVARRALPVGTILDDASFEYRLWPKDLVQGAYYVDDGKGNPNGLRGSVVRTVIAAGQPITVGSVVQPQDRGFLAAALTPGMRALSVPAVGTSGVAGFVFPGDRVDLMLTSTVDGAAGPSLKATETIVRNIRVLATDQRTVPEDAKGSKEIKSFGMVTLEVTPRIAEKIMVAQTIGSLSLSLRPLADNTSELERAIAAGDVSVPANGDPRAERAMVVQLASRPADSSPTYVTGADVSRFQRSAVRLPQKAPPSGRPTGAPQLGSVVIAEVTKPPVVRVARGNAVTEVPLGAK